MHDCRNIKVGKSNLLIAALAWLLTMTSTGSFAAVGCPDLAAFPYNGCIVDNVRPGGFPHFNQTVNVRRVYLEVIDWTIITAWTDKKTSRSSSLYVTPTDILDITRTKFKLRAKIDANGVVTGKVKIRGKIDELGIKKRRTLMTARFSGEWGMNEIGDLVGFNTSHIVCHNAINNYLGNGGCTENESVYLSLLESVITDRRIVRTEGVAVTTVPVPSAVWLFGSGLLGLIGIARRK